MIICTDLPASVSPAGCAGAGVTIAMAASAPADTAIRLGCPSIVLASHGRAFIVYGPLSLAASAARRFVAAAALGTTMRLDRAGNRLETGVACRSHLSDSIVPLRRRCKRWLTGPTGRTSPPIGSPGPT